MLESLQPVVQDFLVTLLTGVLTVLSGFILAGIKKLFDLVTAKISSIEDERVQKKTKEAVDNLEKIVNTTVVSLQQTLGDNIKKSIAAGDGIYTKEDLYNLKDVAFKTVKSQLTSSTIDLLSQAYEDVEDLIGMLIETAVYSLPRTLTPAIELTSESTKKTLVE